MIISLFISSLILILMSGGRHPVRNVYSATTAAAALIQSRNGRHWVIVVREKKNPTTDRDRGMKDGRRCNEFTRRCNRPCYWQRDFLLGSNIFISSSQSLLSGSIAFGPPQKRGERYAEKSNRRRRPRTPKNLNRRPWPRVVNLRLLVIRRSIGLSGRRRKKRKKEKETSN